MTEVNAGTVLVGKYRLEALIGRGGMGSVWRAEHLALNAPVAVKLLDSPGFASSAEALQRFHREARAAATIRSPHVVQILDHGVDPTLGAPFIVMELMEGESLADRLGRVGRLSPAETTQIFTHVARALTRAHEAEIVHRDLKPDNIFLVRNEDEEVAKVLDFGIAKAHTHDIGHGSATRTGTVMGTAYYMSPEQITGNKHIDFRTDLWALGVIACECLTGRRPFEAETVGGLALKICAEPMPEPSSFGPLPVGFDAWFARAVNRDAAHRFASAREAADALRQVLMGEGMGGTIVALKATSADLAVPAFVPRPASLTTGAPVSAHDDWAPKARRKSGFAVVAWGAVAVAAVAGAAVWWHSSSANRGTEVGATGAATTASAAAATASAVAASPLPVAPIVTADPVEQPPPVAIAASPAAPVAMEPAAPRAVAVAVAVAAPRNPRPPSPKATPASSARETTAKPPRPADPVVATPSPAARGVIDDRH